MKLSWLLLIISVRFIYLNVYPLALSNDEISIAYDAYRLVHTGRDSHGRLFPLAFASLGIAKAPAYAYLLAPFTLIATDDYIARLPSAISGLITIIAIGIIATHLTHKKITGLFASLVLAITPWHVYFSRMALEANLALMFLALGLALSLRKYFRMSGLFFAMSLYAYHSEWLLVPLLLLVLPFKNRWLFLTFIIAVLPIPLAYHFLPDNVIRQSGMETLIHAYSSSLPKILPVFVGNYLQYVNPGYLFFHGLNMFTLPHPYESGLFLWPLLLPFVLGFLHFKKYRFLLLWTLLSPVVSAFTNSPPNPRRDLVSILPYTVWISIGLSYLYSRYQTVFVGLAGLIIYSFSLFSFVYLFYVFPSRAETYPPFRQYSAYLSANSSKYHSALVDFRYGISGQFTGVPQFYFDYYSRDHIRHQHARIDWLSPNFHLVPGIYYIVPPTNAPPLSVRSRLVLVHQFFDITNRLVGEVWTLALE